MLERELPRLDTVDVKMIIFDFEKILDLPRLIHKEIFNRRDAETQRKISEEIKILLTNHAFFTLCSASQRLCGSLTFAV